MIPKYHDMIKSSVNLRAQEVYQNELNPKETSLLSTPTHGGDLTITSEN